MSQQKKQWGAIIVMIALFAMIAFVTNLCTPMATIIKNQGEISNVLAQIGNYGNFVAYLVMGIPAGMLIAKFGNKRTALIGLVVGIVGILIQWYSGQLDAQENLGLVFAVYLVGAFIAGLCMCILNCVVNPMLNLLGGGGNKGNQLIQISCFSLLYPYGSFDRGCYQSKNCRCHSRFDDCPGYLCCGIHRDFLYKDRGAQTGTSTVEPYRRSLETSSFCSWCFGHFPLYGY